MTAEAYIQELLGLPEHIKIACIVGLGHPAEEKQPVSAEKLQRDKIQHNRWS
jgi:nitroreductase